MNENSVFEVVNMFKSLEIVTQKQNNKIFILKYQKSFVKKI